MKKKILILVLTVILLCGLILFIFYLSGFFSRTKTFVIDNEEIELSIPIYSYSFKKDDSKISFKTLDSNYEINLLKDDYQNTMQELTCLDGQVTYYSKDKNLTFYNFDISGDIVKIVSFNYYRGHYCNDKEAEMIDKELQNLNFEISVSKSNTCESEKREIYTNVYTYCLDGVQVSIDNNTIYLRDALNDSLIDMDKIIRKNEITAKYAQGLKETFDDDILFSNLEYSILVCNNGKYIISSSDLEYSNNLCD